MTFQTTRNFEIQTAPRRVNDVRRAMSLLPQEADVDETVLGTAFLVSPYASFILDWSGRILV